MPSPLRLFLAFADFVKFEHTVFALPFAYVGCLMAANGHPTPSQWIWITLAMVGARTAGMGLNRLLDREYDARNPRTRDRALPAGRILAGRAWLLVGLSVALLLASAWHLSWLACALTPVAVGLLWIYSLLKRVTWLAHAGLGLVLACAPAGAWIGVRGSLDLPPLLLAGAVLLWVAGFDILYGCLDVDFDRHEGLHSIPERFGISAALASARCAHVGTVLLLALVGSLLGLGAVYQVGVGVVASLLLYEHCLVAADDLSRMDQAFFTMNGWVSVTLLAFTWLQYRLASLPAVGGWSLP